MKNVAPLSIEYKISFGKNLASSRTEFHNTREDVEGAKRTKRRLKVRMPKTWPPPSWYQSKNGHDAQGDESQKSKDDERQESQGNKGHRGAINFYIGDYRQTKASTDGRETPYGKRTEERRQCRFHIIRKPPNPFEQDHKMLEKYAPACQDAGINSKTTGTQNTTQQPQTIAESIDHTSEAASCD